MMPLTTHRQQRRLRHCLLFVLGGYCFLPCTWYCCHNKKDPCYPVVGIGVSSFGVAVPVPIVGRNRRKQNLLPASAEQQQLHRLPPPTVSSPPFRSNTKTTTELSFSSIPSSSSTTTTSSTRTSTRLCALMDVPSPHFFALAFPLLGILGSWTRSAIRVRMDEQAWDERLRQSYLEKQQIQQQLQQQSTSTSTQPILTELEIRRLTAQESWSAYGGKHQNRDKDDHHQTRSRKKKKNRMNHKDEDDVLYDEDDDIDDDNVEYDPYYDDPYTQDELPQNMPYTVHPRYGDRVYANGEVFYKTTTTKTTTATTQDDDDDEQEQEQESLYYRQGAKPLRNHWNNGGDRDDKNVRFW